MMTEKPFYVTELNVYLCRACGLATWPFGRRSSANVTFCPKSNVKVSLGPNLPKALKNWQLTKIPKARCALRQRDLLTQAGSYSSCGTDF